MSKLEECILGDLVEFQRGYDLPKSKFVEGKYPVQSSNGILGYHNEYKVEGPGITIGRSGTVGTPHLIRENFFPHNTSLFVKEFKGNDIEYIYYLLQYLDLGNQKSGSGVPTMNRNHLHPIKIRAYRDKTYQQRTIKILSLIDKKIQINNQINQELEAMAKTLYDYWFVQFDFPDQNGNPYKSSGGKMVYNPELKREIPEGWGVESVGNLLDKVTKAEKIENNSIEFIGEIPVIDQSQKYIAGFTNNENAILQPQDGHVIFGDHTRVVKYINFDYARGADGTQVLISNNENISNVLLYHMIEDFDLSNYGYARHFKFLKEKTVIVPDKEVSSKFETQANVIYEKIKNNIFENQELTQLRDWLLPMLMNGQVKVEDKT